VDKGLEQSKLISDAKEEKLDLEITSESNFTMQFEGKGKEKYDPNKAKCVPKSNPIVKPVAWKFKEEGIRSGNLLVFHMLPQKATFKYGDGSTITTKRPSKTECSLFVRFVSFYINFC
jgi:hypothetical protein